MNMPKYEEGEIITCYFITDEDTKEIKAWSKSKQLAEFFMEFHNCKKYKLKKITNTIEDIILITEENKHNEIAMASLYTRNREGRAGEIELISLPLTDIENNLVSTETDTFFAGGVNYAFLNDRIEFLKDKYYYALSALLLNSVIKKVVHNNADDRISYVHMDQLSILLKFCISEFE